MTGIFNDQFNIYNSKFILPDGTIKKLITPSKIDTLGWKHKVELEEGIIHLQLV
jgi:nucleoside-diphosphate-sugar epimerase